MSDAVLVALIGGIFTLISSYVAYKSSTEKVIHTMTVQQAVTQTRMETMEKDIKEHNHYAKLFSETIPVVQEQIKVANHRIEDLERKVG